MSKLSRTSGLLSWDWLDRMARRATEERRIKKRLVVIFFALLLTAIVQACEPQGSSPSAQPIAPIAADTPRPEVPAPAPTPTSTLIPTFTPAAAPVPTRRQTLVLPSGPAAAPTVETETATATSNPEASPTDTPEPTPAAAPITTRASEPGPAATTAPAPFETPDPVSTPTASSDAAEGTDLICGGASAEITDLDKKGPPEVVTLSGSGDLTGWYLISVRGSQRFDFPAGFNLNGTVQILSATDYFEKVASSLFWTTANMWSNSNDDDAELYDCSGVLVSEYDDGS